MTLLVASLSGCGAGGGSDDAAPESAPPLAAPQVVAPPTQTVSAPAVVGGNSGAEAIASSEAAAAEMAQAAAKRLAAESSSTGATVTAQSDTAEATFDALPSRRMQALAAVPQVTIRARADLAGGVGASMAVRVNGSPVGTVEVRSTTYKDYSFNAPGLRAGSKVEVAFTNDGKVGNADRNLYIAYVSDAQQYILPTATGAVVDKGAGAKAFDGVDTVAWQGALYGNAALRLTWPAVAEVAGVNLASSYAAVRFLSQASFGPTTQEIANVVSRGYAGWIDAQMAQRPVANYVNHIQAKYNLGDAYRPKGANYTAYWLGQKFWERSANAPDQLRKRVAHALQQIMVVSLVDSNMWFQARPYAAYLDTLDRNAFGNFRNLIEEISLSPAMGIYLSHMRNRKEDPTTGRVPDENFARELMQLFTIGLHELNIDGTPKLDANGEPIETYNNTDVMALAKVFTGWSWAFPDSELTDSKFRWGEPVTTAAGDTRIDILPMKAYPGQHSTAEKTLFAGKPWGTTIPAGGSAPTDLKIALDTLFNHPNVGPFIGRQLIQRLVSSNPSPAYVARVAAVFNNNGSGVRGDLGAVVKAILLDTEARSPDTTNTATKLREPVLRVAHWMRALGARSASGEYMMAWELDGSGQRVLYAPSVFNHYRPGYTPPNTSFTARGATVPEFQIVNESSVAGWINSAEGMAGAGMGWSGTVTDVSVNHAALGAVTSSGNLGALADQMNLLMLGGRMSPALRRAIIDATSTASGSDDPTRFANRARAAAFLTLASPEFLTQP